MELTSLPFFVLIIVGLFTYHFFFSSRFSLVVLFGINFCFVGSYISSFIQLLPLLLFVLVGYLVICLVQRYQNKLFFGCSIIFILLLFIYIKKYTVINNIPSIPIPYLIVGVSYILFRILHLVIDVYGGAITKHISFLHYLIYIFFFLTFISGPIQRFQDFLLQLEKWKIEFNREYVLGAFSRISNGYIKIYFSSVLLLYHQKFYGRLDQELSSVLTLMYCGAAIFYCMYLYINFSGYMDVIIGLGKFFGFLLPENFDFPFVARNFLGFWSKWHITLSEWFKYYLFNPLLKKMTYKYPNVSVSQYIGVIAFFITFLIMGIWHGTTLLFFIYGLFLGFGVSVNKLYQVLIKKWMGKKKYKKLTSFLPYSYCCQGMSVSYFVISLTCLWSTPHEFLALIETMGFVGCLCSFLIISTIVSGMSLGISFLMDFGKIVKKPIMFITYFWVPNAWIALKFFFLINMIFIQTNSAPEFVYKAF
jgi:alginate O-acetyltransferase complex protein AlgI